MEGLDSGMGCKGQKEHTYTHTLELGGAIGQSPSSSIFLALQERRIQGREWLMVKEPDGDFKGIKISNAHYSPLIQVVTA